jgi:protein involved in polysaccharide export with SLBB domain
VHRARGGPHPAGSAAPVLLPHRRAVRPRLARLLLAVACAAGATGIAVALTPPTLSAQERSAPPASQVVDDPVLRPGDILRVTVWRKPELSGEFSVASDGGIRHPLYQAVKVSDVALSEATRRLHEFLKTYEQNPQVLLEPLFRVTVGGEVRMPNLLTLPRETTLAQSIALAGGPTDFGTLERVRLVRGDQELVVNLTDARGQWARTTVASGDQIFVQRRRDFLRTVLLPALSVLGSLAAVATLARQ